MPAQPSVEQEHTMTTDDHGPGVTWLAQRAGIPPEQLLRDGTALMRSLEGAARDAIDLGQRLMSADPAIRIRAEAQARALRAKLAPASGSQTPEERFRAKVAEALAKRDQPTQA